MKKRVTPEQVKNGKVIYAFEDFLNDLWQDVKSTLSKEYNKKISDKEQRDVFNFVYDLCYLAAMNHPELKRMLKKADSGNKDIMEKTLESNHKNIALLQSIFMKEIADRLKKGLTERQAVKATIEESKNVFTNWIK
jgi:hypothetical protein